MEVEVAAVASSLQIQSWQILDKVISQFAGRSIRSVHAGKERHSLPLQMQTVLLILLVQPGLGFPGRWSDVKVGKVSAGGVSNSNPVINGWHAYLGRCSRLPYFKRLGGVSLAQQGKGLQILA